MSRINTVPRGLQAFLGNTNFGDNPSEMHRIASGTVELSRFLITDKVRTWASAPSAVNAGGTIFATQTVPLNECWFVLGGGFRAVNTVGVGLSNACISINATNYAAHDTSPVGPNQIPMLNWPYFYATNLQNAEGVRGMEWFPEPFPIPSGVQIDWICDSISAGDAFNMEGYLWFVPLAV